MMLFFPNNRWPDLPAVMALESISTRVLPSLISTQKISGLRKATMLRMLALKSLPLHVEMLTVPVKIGLMACLMSVACDEPNWINLPLELEKVDDVLLFRLLVMMVWLVCLGGYVKCDIEEDTDQVLAEILASSIILIQFHFRVHMVWLAIMMLSPQQKYLESKDRLVVFDYPNGLW
jgi:hypothetical protein